MKKKQIIQFNRMRRVLSEISKKYMTPDQLRKACEKGYGGGVDYNEALEMAYENIQAEAATAVKGIRMIKEPNPERIATQQPIP